MPLIVICGCPVSGKTTRAKELKEFFEKTHNKQVEIVSEEEAIAKLGYELNATYLDSQKEKRMRGYLKSEVLKLIGKDNVVILDGSNYIKGYRYELYCASKASKCTQCTLYTIRNHQEAWEVNLTRLKSGDQPDSGGVNAYTEEVFNALTKFRFEEPNSNNRWDSPLFAVLPEDQLDLEAIYGALFEKKPPPPNQSTQNPPLSATNFLYELDKVTQSISKHILDSKQISQDSEVRFPEYPGCVLDSAFMQMVTPQKLLRLRRQFLTYAKMNHANEETNKIGSYKMDIPYTGPHLLNPSSDNSYKLDKVIHSITKQIGCAKLNSTEFLNSMQISQDSEVKFPEYPCVLDSAFMQMVTPQLRLRLRRQFLTHAKMNHAIEKTNKIGRYFTQYLNKTMSD